MFDKSRSGKGVSRVLVLIAALTLALGLVPLSAMADDGTYTVTLTANPLEGGTVTGAGTYSDGDAVLVSASASNGYQFDHWAREDGSTFDDVTFSFAIHENRTYEAVFTKAPLESVTINLDPPVADGHSDTWNKNPADYVSIPDGVSYSISSVHNRWLKADGTPTGSGSSEYSYMFSAGTRYAVRLTLAPTGEATFSEDTAVITNDGVNLVSKTFNGDGTLTVIINIAAIDVPKTYIDTVPMTIAIPTAGMTVSAASNDTSGIVTIPSGQGYGFNVNPIDYYEYHWQNSAGNYLADDYEFEPGTTYRLLVGLITDSAYYAFTNPTTVNVTGEGASLVSVGTPGSDQNRSTLTVIINVSTPGEHAVAFDMRGHYTPVPATQLVVDGGHATQPTNPVTGSYAADYDTTGLTFRTWMIHTPDQLTGSTVNKLSTQGGDIFDFAGEAITDTTIIYAAYDGTLTTEACEVHSLAKVGGKVRSKSVASESSFAAGNRDTVIAGSWVSVYAEPDEGVTFLGWSTSKSEDDIVSTETEYRFEFTASTTLYALFSAPPVTITLKGSDIKGESTISDMTIQVPYGTSYNSLPQATKNSVTAHFGGGAYLIGTNNAVMLMPNTLASYSSWSEVSAANQINAALTQDATFYIPLSTRVEAIELTLEAPVCGVEVSGSGFDGQENGPVITYPDGGYQGDTRTARYSMWAKSVTDRSAFVGTIEGGTTYHAHIWIEAQFGYFINTRFTTVTVNGEAPEEFSSSGLERVGFFAAIEAVHDPAEAVEEHRVEPTYDAAGSYEEVVYCSACGAELSRETKSIDPLDPGFTVTFDMDGHGEDVVVEHVAAGTAVADLIDQFPTARLEGVDGYHFFAFAPKNVDGYTSVYDAAVASRSLLGEEVNADMTICTVWFQVITSIEGSVAAPVCGAQVELTEGDSSTPSSQTNHPQVTPTGDAHYTVEFLGSTFTYWMGTQPGESGDIEPFEGSIVGGTAYPFMMYAFADYGYVFAGTSDVSVSLDGADSCTVDGTMTMPNSSFFPPEEFQRSPLSLATISGEVTAQHDPAEAVQENAVDPTCTTDGSYEEVVYCTACGLELSREAKTVDALGHDPAEAVQENVVDPTCTEAGSYDEVVYCTVCGEELSREKKTVDVLGHDPAEAVQENVVDPTCTEAGSYEEVVYCTVCGEELSRETKTVDALGHDWGEWEVTTEPTYEADGEETRVCSRDATHTETRPIDKLTPEPEPEPEPIDSEVATLTFDLGGGTLDGKTGTITIQANVGDTIKLPGAPTKSGYTFKCWKGSEYEAGADYTVEDDHQFTAEWVKTIPGTGDRAGMALAALALVAAASLAVLIACALRRRRCNGSRAE